MTDRESCIILNMISGIGFVKYNALCGHFGSPSAALNAPAEKLAQVRGIGVQLSERLSTWRESCDLAGELSRAERGGVRIITLVAMIIRRFCVICLIRRGCCMSRAICRILTGRISLV